MKYFNTEQNCRNLRKVHDLAAGFPFWPGYPNNWTETRQEMREAFQAATPDEQDALAGGSNPSWNYSGWSLHQNDVFPVDPPGFGHVLDVPDDLVTVVFATALNQHNVSLTPDQVLLGIGAVAVLQENLPEAWEPEE